MHRIDLTNKITSKKTGPRTKSMQVLNEQSNVYFNFANSLDSGRTRQSYEFCIQKFLNHYHIDLETLLKLPQQDISNLLIKYLVEMKISKSYKNQIFSAIRHACEMNDVILNWKKLKKFIKSEKTGNQSSKDRGYTHEEIQKILVFCDQRIRTAFLLLASTGMRIKIRWNESLNWESKSSFGDNIKIRPVNFSTEHKNMLSNLHTVISKRYLAIDSKHDKLLTSLRTAYAEELNLKKEQTSYSDLLDALRLALKGYNIE